MTRALCMLLLGLAGCQAIWSAYPDAAEIPWDAEVFQPEYASPGRIPLDDGGCVDYRPGSDDFEDLNEGRTHVPGQLARLDRAGEVVWRIVQEPAAPDPSAGLTDAFYQSRFERQPHMWWREAEVLVDGTQVYVVSYCRTSDGGTVVAFDLLRGRQRWSRHIQGLGDVYHSRYVNEVRARLIDGALVVVGQEGYVE